MPDKDGRTKPKYEPPTLVPLGELAKGAGDCQIGSGFSAACITGQSATSVCVTGAGATSTCDVGGTDAP